MNIHVLPEWRTWHPDRVQRNTNNTWHFDGRADASESTRCSWHSWTYLRRHRPYLNWPNFTIWDILTISDHSVQLYAVSTGLQTTARITNAWRTVNCCAVAHSRVIALPYGNMESWAPHLTTHITKTSQFITMQLRKLNFLGEKNALMKFGWNPPAMGRWNIGETYVQYTWLPSDFSLPALSEVIR